MVVLKRRQNANNSSSIKSKRSKSFLDLALDQEDVVSSDEEEDHDVPAPSSSDDDEETVEAKRVRMARAYLHQIETSQPQESVSEEEDAIAATLQRQRLWKKGTPLKRHFADNVVEYYSNHIASLLSTDTEENAKRVVSSGQVELWRGHDLTPTCLSMPFDSHKCVSGSKDHSVYLWDVTRQGHSKTCIVPHYKKDSNKDRNGGQVTSIAFRSNYIVVGRHDATLTIHDVRLPIQKNKITTLSGHKGPVTALRFGQDLQLFSASTDRCIRHYNLQEMAYIETLYGHQAGVVDLDCAGDVPISVGRDRTARVWKLQEDSHLIFRGKSSWYSAERICALDKKHYMTGHAQHGTLALWNVQRKKAIDFIQHAHGLANKKPCGITALATCPFSDLVVSGSHDGYLRAYKVTANDRTKSTTPTIESLDCKIPLWGYCNDVAIASDGSFCLVALGQEPRLGRWDRVPRAKNRIAMVKLRNEKSQNGNDKQTDNKKQQEEANDDGETDSDSE